jgi:branched-chain amino acid transport system permease protein
MLTLLFDGVAYGMLLFLLAVGLAVTLGLMNFINLAHGAFAMAGGYITVLLMNHAGVPFLACLPLSFLGAGLLGAVLEPTLYRRMYARPHLDQVLFSIGLFAVSDGGRLLRRLDAPEIQVPAAAGPLRHRVDRDRLSPLHRRRRLRRRTGA